jgi:hypothetical protein
MSEISNSKSEQLKPKSQHPAYVVLNQVLMPFVLENINNRLLEQISNLSDNQEQLPEQLPSIYSFQDYKLHFFKIYTQHYAKDRIKQEDFNTETFETFDAICDELKKIISPYSSLFELKEAIARVYDIYDIAGMDAHDLCIDMLQKSQWYLSNQYMDPEIINAQKKEREEKYKITEISQLYKFKAIFFDKYLNDAKKRIYPDASHLFEEGYRDNINIYLNDIISNVSKHVEKYPEYKEMPTQKDVICNYLLFCRRDEFYKQNNLWGVLNHYLLQYMQIDQDKMY